MLFKRVIARRDDIPLADRGGSTSVRGRIRSLHSSGGLQGSCAAYSPRPAGTNRRTDGRIAVSLNAPTEEGTTTRPLTPHIMQCYRLPTKGRSNRDYNRGHRFYDVTSPCVNKVMQVTD